MKKFSFLFLTLLCSVLGLTAQTSVEFLGETNQAITLRFRVEGFTTQTVSTPEGPAVLVDIEEGTPLLKTGAPELPKLTASVVLGDLTTSFVVVESATYTDYPNVTVAPSKGNLLRNVDPATVPYAWSEVYQTNAFFPGELATLRNPYIYRDFRGQTAVVYPVQYNPVTKVLRVYDEIVISIKQSEGNAINPLIRPADRDVKVLPVYQDLYQNRFANFTAQGSRYEQVSEFGNMLIISPSDYIAQMEPLARWKRERGIPTEIVDIAEIGNTEADIYNYVQEYYHTEGLTYLLLVGDENAIVSAQTNSNNACDHCYGYLEGDDHYAEVFVGRFNGENADHIQTMIDRNLEYEKNPDMDQDWFSIAVGSGSAEGPGDDGEMDFAHINNIKTWQLAYTYTKVYEFHDGSQGNQSPTPGDATADANGNPSNTSIANVLNTVGASIYNYTGHGWNGGLASGDFNTNTVDAMTNVGKYPFLIAVACCVGDFQNDFGAGECLGDRWVRNTHNVTGEPTGGIGGAFSSVLQSWSPPMEGQDEMNKLIVGTGDYSIRRTLGSILIHGCASMNDAYGAGGDEMSDTWNLFGDPSVMLWSAMPQEMTVSHPVTVEVGTAQMTVECDVEDAMISLYYLGEVLGYGMVENGQAIISFEAVSVPEMITVTATKHNYMPYQGEVEVLINAGPFVILSDYVINDPTGNNDNLADYSEEIILDVVLENVGPFEAGSVIATLSSMAPHLTVVDNVQAYGDIAALEQAMQANAFTFTVNEVIPDGYEAYFDLEVVSGGNVWNYTLIIELRAPVLETADVLALDDQTGGNDNNRMDSGETVALSIPSFNEGQSASPLANGVLSTSSPWVTILDPSVDLGAIAASGGEVSASFDIQIAPNTPMRTPVQFVYELQAGAYSETRTYDAFINLIVEDFESNGFETFDWNTTQSESSWFATEYNPFAGDVCSQSGAIPDAAETILELTVNVLEAGPISFARRTSCEDGWDYLRFYIDLDLQAEWTGELGWEVVTFDVPAGQHTFRWAYEKDEIFTGGEDAVWIDDIILPLIETDINSGVVTLPNLDLALDIWPNPATREATLTLEQPEAKATQILLLNANGQVVNTLFDGQLAGGTTQHAIPVSALPAGEYFVLIRQEDGQLVRKLVKQ